MVNMCREKKTGMAEEMPSKWRKASVASLYWMRYFTGSQWSSFKSGVTWPRFDFSRWAVRRCSGSFVCANISMSEFNKFTAQWDLSEAAVAALAEDSYTSKAALLGLIGEDTDYFEGLKRGNRVAATQLVQMEYGDGPPAGVRCYSLPVADETLWRDHSGD